MRSHHSWFSDLAFGTESAQLGAVGYESHRKALSNARSALVDPRGVGLVIGPEGSGKSTAARELGDALSGENAVAVVDGVRLNAQTLLSEILAQFGFVVEVDAAEELMDTLASFAAEQARAGDTPVVIIDNADRMYPSGLRALDRIADCREQSRFTLRLILTGRPALRKLVSSQQLVHVGDRVVNDYTLEPMTMREAMAYLHNRLSACGVRPPDSVFPVNVCDRLHARSGGWPGVLNAQAIDAIERASDFPVSLADLGESELPELPYREPERVAEITEPPPELAPDLDLTKPPMRAPKQQRQDADRGPPKLIITRDGKSLSTYTFRDKKVLIGRSEFADVIISDGYVSKLHALMLAYSDALVLLDLNSANGLTVNSTVVRSTILQTGDVIVLGNHRIKVENAPTVSERVAKILQSGDTVKMKSLMDSRRRRLLKAKLKVVDS